VQDESSCLVPDMPRAARRIGAADHVVALAHLAADILRRAD
jgi:chemotaxis response regulator CheB